ncbi:hypothetical protein ADUPG1_010956 [Aduncisulcus paluster]|uniref:Reverse transcriptase domain-containing protein n=1 Tax=Aduncisulcus paluster TaxID=2918883 RepID=A0ABQ5JXJ1_9EUKA|nr:hypothetical protein ADUPG1_010956 [Aduncisulcus paluster]
MDFASVASAKQALDTILTNVRNYFYSQKEGKAISKKCRDIVNEISKQITKEAPAVELEDSSSLEDLILSPYHGRIGMEAETIRPHFPATTEAGCTVQETNRKNSPIEKSKDMEPVTKKERRRSKALTESELISSQAILTIEAKLKQPLLSTFTRKSCTTFKRKFEVYSKKGGIHPADDCVTGQALLIWQMRSRNSNPSNIMDFITDFLKPKSTRELLARLRKVELKDIVSPEELMRFSAEYKDVLDDSGSTPLQIAEALDLYCSRIPITSVRKAIEAGIRIMTVKTVEDALEIGLTALSELKDPRYLQDKKQDRRGNRERKGKTCDYCHKKGHDAKECRKKKRDEAEGKKGIRRIKGGNTATGRELRGVFLLPKGKTVEFTGLADTGADCNLIHPNLFKDIEDNCTHLSGRSETLVRDGKTVTTDQCYLTKIRVTNTIHGHPIVADFEFVVSDIISDYMLTAGAAWLMDVGVIQSILQEGELDDDEEYSDDIKVPTLDIRRIRTPEDEVEKIDMGAELKTRVLPILHEFKDVFNPNLPKRGSKLKPYSINLINEEEIPFKTKTRFLSPPLMKVTKETLDELLADGHIVKSESEWASPIVLVRKKDNSWRLCVDYRRLNKLIKSESLISPNMEMAFRNLKDCKWFATLDFRSGFHQIKLTKKSRKLTAFVTPFGTFEYTVMPFGVSTAPKVFMSAVYDAFEDLIATNRCYIYIDDVVPQNNSK